MLARARIVAALIVIALVAVACGPSGSSALPTRTGPGAGASPGCGGAGAPEPTTGGPAASAGCASPLRPLTVGLGYIPSVQFAPFYLAQQEGLYASAGLQVTFQHKIDPDLVTLVGAGNIDIGVADGTSVIPAVSQGIPIQYVATIYGTFPNVVVALQPSGIDAPAALKGKRIGTPGKYGSSWIMLQALLGSANLTTDDVQVVEYPDFGQAAGLAKGAVDAVTGFTNNEPVVLAQQLEGTGIVQLHVDSILALPGPGLIAGTKLLAGHPDVVRAFIAATLQAMNEIRADPAKGLAAAKTAVPDLDTTQAVATQQAVLNATIATWASPNPKSTGFGWIDVDGWKASVDYLTTLKLVPNPVTVDHLVDTTLLPAGGASVTP